VYCLAPCCDMTRFYANIQNLFPIAKKIPYMPVLYHFIPYLLFGENLLFSTSELIQKHFKKNSPIWIILSSHEYPVAQADALAWALRQKGFTKINGRNVVKDNDTFRINDFQIGHVADEDADLCLRKMWWIEQAWFRFFLRISRASVAALLLIPIFLWMRKNF
jgi:hypothetical protein